MARQARKKRRQAKLESSMALSLKRELKKTLELSQEEMLREKNEIESSDCATNSLASFFTKEQLDKLNS